MNKLARLLTWSFFLLGFTQLAAQPSLLIEQDFVLVDEGDEACLSFTVLDFTDIVEVRFSVRWDPEVVTMQPINPASFNPAMTNLTVADFVIDNDEGYFTFIWKSDDNVACPQNPVTLQDNEAMFEACFVGINGYTDVEISNDPEPVQVVRVNSCPIDICFGDCTLGTSFIAVNNQPIILDIPTVNVNEGETFCVDLQVSEFEDIISMQYSITWDPNLFTFESIQCNPNLPNCSMTNFNTLQAGSGVITFSWFNSNPAVGLTLPDGTDITQLCLTAIGNCPNDGLIEIVGMPTEVEITNVEDPGQDIGLLNGVGQVFINCFDPNALTIDIPDASICPGENFCMDVTVANFTDLVQTDFSINWNPNIIDLTAINNVNTNLTNFNLTNINQAGANGGSITVSWDDFTCFGDNLNDDEVLFTMCFSSVGGGGVNTTVAITGDPLDIYVSDACGSEPTMPMNTLNGFVDVCSPPGITLIAGNQVADPGDDVCVSILVQDFDGILEMGFTLEWETSVLQYTGVENFGLPNLTGANFDDQLANFGAICVDWTDLSGTGETLSDGSILFDICFEAVGGPFACSEINFVNFPCEAEVITTESNGFPVEVNSVPGEVCLTNPFSFALTVSDTTSIPGDLVCVDFTVNNFVSLEELSFSVNWDENIVQFFDLENPFTLTNFTEGSFDDSNAGAGILTVDWTSLNSNGVSLPNGTAIFSLCFIIIGEAGQCSPISITSSPSAIEVIPANSGGQNVGMVNVDGEICVSPSIGVADELITSVDCPGDNSGGIDITVEGGSGVYVYQWSGPGITPPDDMNEDQVGLTDGTYFITVTDFNFPFLVTVDTFIVGASGDAPVADAGENTQFPCGMITTSLDGTGSTTGAQIEYFWYPAMGMGLVTPGTETTLTPTIVGQGTYVLDVTDISTGCTVSDTVIVTTSIAPGAEIMVMDSITCDVDTVDLIGTGSSEGPFITYNWTTADGQLVAGTETSLDAQALAGGTYIFTVTNTQSGCESVDSVTVAENTADPVVDAGVDTMITCNQPIVVLDGSASAIGSQYVYEWLDPNMSVVSNQLTVNASEAGTYQLTVTDTITGCFATDQVLISPDNDLPDADAGLDQFITCVTDTVTLDGSNSSNGDVFAWTGPGIISDPSLSTIQANQAGTYTLTVTNTANGCEGISEVVVSLDQTPPTAEAGAALDTLDCNVEQIQLDGSASSTGMPGEYSYFWTGGLIQAGTEVTLFPIIEGPGIYTLQVTDNSNGCTATDVVEIVQDGDVPVAVIGTPEGTELTCVNNVLTMDVSGSSSGPNISTTWEGPFCINTITNEIFCDGTFEFVVVNTANGCTARDTVVVTENITDVLAVVENGTYTCNDDCISLNTTGTTTGVNIVYSWEAFFGGVIGSGEDTIDPEICAPGSYGFTVQDTTNGCTDVTSVSVVPDTIAPVANAGMDGTINCYQDFVNLDGSGSSPANLLYTWTLGGTFFSDMVNPVATEPGTYVLEVTNNDNGCVDEDEVIVDLNQTAPVADAGEDQELGCGENSVVLDGSGSAAGPNIIYMWTALAGMLEANTVTLQSAIANGEGSYELTVTDTLNGCSSSDVVDVQQVIGFPEAEALIMGDPCEINAVLEGNLPEGTTGVWTTTSSATIADNTAAMTAVEGLTTGVNSFTWTLSAPDCPDYSTASVEIEVEGVPVANNDLIVINTNIDSITINVLTNDILQGVPNYSVEFISDPNIGTVGELKDGEFVYTLPPLFNGEVIIDYQICNDNCPDLCDQAFIQITIDRDIEAEDTVPNGITPNGDGVNDELVFDILLIDPELRENSEIIIFNRWGDIVFEAAPYNNDWAGVNMDGQPLPPATYYYILNLNIGDGNIIQGDITILK